MTSAGSKMETTPRPQTFDRERASMYDTRIRWIAPAYNVLHTAVLQVLSSLLERQARVLVVGAGTGAEIARLGRAQPGWQFTAVDASSAMLERCRERVAEEGLQDSVDYCCGRIEALEGATQYDAATSVFVVHFIQDLEAKRRYFCAIARRLRPKAPFVVADLFRDKASAPFEVLFSLWRRHYGQVEGATDQEETFTKIAQHISFLPEADLKVMLEEMGFEAPVRFYQSYLWGAWWTRKRKEQRS